ncbi:MAG: hypothetical protein U0326_06025 [Polyangiales bacterium]
MTLKRLGLTVADIDLWEVEAFAVVALAVAQEAGLGPREGQRERRRGGLGHPISASRAHPHDARSLDGSPQRKADSRRCASAVARPWPSSSRR